MVLVRPPVGRVEQERLALAGSLEREPLVVDAVVDHPHAFRGVTETLDEVVANVFADGDHDPARHDRAAVDVAPVAQLWPREELRVGLVLEVVDRRGRGCVHAREHHGQRKVEGDRVVTVEDAPQTSVRDRGERQAGDPAQSARPAGNSARRLSGVAARLRAMSRRRRDSRASRAGRAPARARGRGSACRRQSTDRG